MKLSTRASGPGGGSEAETEKKLEVRVAEDAHSGDEYALSETGAVNEISSEDEGKGWATPRTPNEDLPACPLTIAEDCHRNDLPLNAISWRDESHLSG